MSDRPDYATDDGIERILVVTAHPDDVDFGSAGSVATWVDAGIAVTYCLVTNGEAGGEDREMPRSDMAELRQAEQTAAAAAVGVHDLRFLGYPDGRVEATLELRRDISRVIRQVRPQRVVAQSPQRMFERIHAGHPDHLAAGEATVCAVYPDSRNPFAHPELLHDERLEPWTVPQLWMAVRADANVSVDISDAIDRKVSALCSHESQIKDREGVEKMVRDWTRAIAERAGLPNDRYAEAYLAVDTR